jgi:hypothetical protein
VAKYASKGESSSTTYDKSLQMAISHLQNTDTAGIAYQKMLSSFVAERDISGQETCHILLGCKLIHTSQQTRSLCVSPNASEHLDFEHSSSTHVGIMERYKQHPGNPHPAADITLLDFATNWDWRGNRIVKRGLRGAKSYIVNVWPRYRPDPEHEETYEKYCYARMILNHPFTDPDDLLQGCPTWKDAYHLHCLDQNHIHNDTLPTPFDDDNEDDESDTESVPGDVEEDYHADWMREAARLPNQAVESTLPNLGLRDIDIEYDWHEGAPSAEVIQEASRWLAAQVKESPNDDVQILPEVDYANLKAEQRDVFLQVMAYFKKLKANDGDPKPPPFRINVDGTAGTGKSFLIWAISTALREMFMDELQGKDPVVQLAPTGISAFGIRGWTINFGLSIPVKEGKEFQQLGESALQWSQVRWRGAKLLILDEKSMVGRAQMGRADRRLRQVFPAASEDTLGSLPAIFFGDFAQLPPIGDTPLYSSKTSGGRRLGLALEGR